MTRVEPSGTSRIQYIHKIKKEKEPVIYHRGQYSPRKRLFLQALVKSSPKNCNWYHWSDIDYGGFIMPFEERFGLIADAEWATRKSNKLIRLIKNAGYEFNNACVEDIDYRADRKLDRAQITALSTCNYIIDP